MNGIDPRTASLYEQIGIGSKPAETRDAGELGQDAFLQLMTTQLQNQDPFQPMENGEFLGQMAQFGTVSGISELQGAFENMASSLQGNRALQASVMVGRQVLVPSNGAELPAEGGVSGAVELPASAGNVVVGFYNVNGELVHELPLGPQAAGVQHFEWDGTLADGNRAPAGVYEMRAQAQIGEESGAVGTLLAGNVDSVTLGSANGDFTLHVAGIGDVRLSDVYQINE
jgi:flagellar basal-body rod modification protein FlgD